MRLFREPNPEAINAHWVNIKVKNYSDLIEYIEWRNLPFHTRVNFDWYFKYRAASLQIKYPYYDVELKSGIEDIVPENLQELQLKNKITARKRKITEIENKVRMAKDAWEQLFPIEEDVTYQKVEAKLCRLKNELKELQEHANRL